MTHWKPDKTDLQILNILQTRARINVTVIARMLGLTPQPIHDRIFRLEREGYITGYLALLSREKIGVPVLVVVLVKLEKQTRALLQAFEKTAATMPEIQFCLHLSGKWDFLLHVTAETPQDYYVLLMEKICATPNVEHVESSFVLKECKSFSPFVLG